MLNFQPQEQTAPPPQGQMILTVVDGHYLLLTPTAIQEITYTEYLDYKQMQERSPSWNFS